MTRRGKQAAEWLIRLENAEVSADELLRWQAWMERSARNRQTFQETEQLSRRMSDRMGGLKDIPIPSLGECGLDYSNALESILERLGLQPAGLRGRARDTAVAWPPWARRAAIAAGIAAVLAGVAYLMPPGILDPEITDQVQSYRTDISEHRRLVLPDGSSMSMGAKSLLSVNFSPQHRIVMLEGGEVLFDIAEDPGRPFIVMAGTGTITALGTVFNVRRDGDRVVVTVTAGNVEVKRTPLGLRGGDWRGRPAQSPMTATIGAGGQAVVSPTKLSVVELNDPVAVTEWQNGLLQYRAEPFKYVIAGVNRYSTREIIIADTEVEEMLFTGSVFQDQTEDWLTAVEAVFPVEVVYAGHDKVLIRKRIESEGG